jgi:hypothetical protein
MTILSTHLTPPAGWRARQHKASNLQIATNERGAVLAVRMAGSNQIVPWDYTPATLSDADYKGLFAQAKAKFGETK